ncbi:MAG: type II secretion system F family protein [Actinomycetales bacterium]
MGALVGLLFGVGVLLIVLSLDTHRDRTAAKSRAVGRLQRLVDASGIARLTISRLIFAAASVALIVALLVLVVTTVPMAALLAGIVGAAVPFLLVRRRARLRQRALRTAWPDAVDALVSAVRAGMALPEAMADLSRNGPEPLRAAFTVFASEYRATGSFAHALDTLQDFLVDPVADRVVASMRIARQVGGTDLGTVLRTLSALLREDARARGEIEARQSWTVSAARLSVAAPWITLALLCTRPEAVAAYRSATGAIVLAVSAVLSIAAYRVMLAIGRLPTEPRMVR